MTARPGSPYVCVYPRAEAAMRLARAYSPMSEGGLERGEIIRLRRFVKGEYTTRGERAND